MDLHLMLCPFLELALCRLMLLRGCLKSSSSRFFVPEGLPKIARQFIAGLKI